MRVMLAAAAYFATVFIAALTFGAIRTLVLEPRIGETLAVLCEAPLLLLTFYLVVKYIVARCGVPHAYAPLLAVGLIGLLLQQIAEVGLVFASGETLAMHLAYLRTPAGLIYLALLFAFAVMPAVVLRRRA